MKLNIQIGLLAVLALAGAASGGELELYGSGWRSGRHAGTVESEGRLTLAGTARIGSWVHAFPGAPPDAGWDRFLPSLNPDPFPPGASVALRVRFQVAGGWTEWLPLGLYGQSETLPRSEPSVTSRGVTVETDIVSSKTPLLGGEVALILRREGEEAPRVRRIVLDQWRRIERVPAPARRRHVAWGRATRPPERAQGWLGPPLASRTCSPTSLGMVLAHHGVECTSLQVAQGVYDRGGDLYGNWSFNVAYAASRGLRATARHLTSWEAVEDEIAAGRPVVISHRYRKGELSHPAVGATVGHLIVLVGFTAEGDVVVHDPAGNTREGRPIRRVYRRDELWRSWQQNHEGVAYVLRPDPLVTR